MLYPDISHYHPVTDWSKAKENCGFLISKATEGKTYVDPTLEDFISGCEKSGIPYWLYTYLKKGNELAQAEFLLTTCEDKVGANFVGYILDAEAGNDAADVLEAMNYLIDQEVKVMLYTGYSDYDKYESVILSIPTTGTWWEARYGKNDGTYNDSYPCHDGASLHQYTSKGSCPGIDGSCDLNRITGASKDEEWFKTPLNPPEATAPLSGTTLDLVYSTMEGAYGTGAERKAALGDRYDEVQAVINHIASSSVDTLVEETLAGDYGNGNTRKVVLGSRYDEVQAKINAGSVSYFKKYTGKSYSIVDALDAIGADSSFDSRGKIAAANGISNYSGTASENTKMLSLLKEGKLIKP